MARENKEHWREGMNPSKDEIEMTARLILQNREIKSLRAQLADANEIARFYGEPQNQIKYHLSSWQRISPLNDDEIIQNYKHPERDWIGSIVVAGKRAREYCTKWKVKNV
jgi:hypothetical protein